MRENGEAAVVVVDDGDFFCCFCNYSILSIGFLRNGFFLDCWTLSEYWRGSVLMVLLVRRCYNFAREHWIWCKLPQEPPLRISQPA